MAWNQQRTFADGVVTPQLQYYSDKCAFAGRQMRFLGKLAAVLWCEGL
jgi:hypothetical protein